MMHWRRLIRISRTKGGTVQTVAVDRGQDLLNAMSSRPLFPFGITLHDGTRVIVFDPARIGVCGCRVTVYPAGGGGSVKFRTADVALLELLDFAFSY